MSIKSAFLALLSERPMHGYQLRQEFDSRTGGTWPLNIGQAYTTLQRLERDGLVQPLPAEGDAPETFALTDKGQAETEQWWHAPVQRDAPSRDELSIKLALAVTIPGVDVSEVIQIQRTETLKTLRSYTQLKRSAAAPHEAAGTDLAWLLVLDSLIFKAEAEVRWLDHVEGTVIQSSQRDTGAPAQKNAATPRTDLSAPMATPSTAGGQR